METTGTLEAFQDRSKPHVFGVTVANLVENTKDPRCHFGWPRGSTLLSKDGHAQLDIVIAEDMNSRANIDSNLHAVICQHPNTT